MASLFSGLILAASIATAAETQSYEELIAASEARVRAGDYESAVRFARTALAQRPGDKRALALVKLNEGRASGLPPAPGPHSSPARQAVEDGRPAVLAIASARNSGPPPTPGAAGPDYLPADLRRHYSDDAARELASLIDSAREGVREHYRKNPLKVADATSGTGFSGVAANAWEGVPFLPDAVMLMLGSYPAKPRLPTRSCIETQCAALEAMSKAPVSRLIRVARISISRSFPYRSHHHAVILFPVGTDYRRTGIVLDPWIRQSTEPEDCVFRYEAWKWQFLFPYPEERLEDL